MLIRILTGAVALTLSTAAFAAEPASDKPKMECCCKKGDDGKMACCEKKAKGDTEAATDGDDKAHDGHDMGGMSHD